MALKVSVDALRCALSKANSLNLYYGVEFKDMDIDELINVPKSLGVLNHRTIKPILEEAKRTNGKSLLKDIKLIAEKQNDGKFTGFLGYCYQYAVEITKK
ncbi:hypothetical protein [Orbus mooreae]|uniref:hypothetical protein n=1 Tax=Orbus mooreae TaxID=3074107 RepID=UPI00370DC878